MYYVNQILEHFIITGAVIVLGFFFKNRIINIFKKLFGHLFEKRIYKEAAKKEPFKTVDSVFEFAVITFAIYCLVAGFNNWFALSDLNREAIKTEKMAIKNKGLKDCDECSPVKVMRVAKDAQIEISKKRIENIIFIGACSFLFLYNLTKVARRSIIHDLKIEFEQDMNKIRPYIEDKEFHQINSAWAYMENAQDYQAIQDRIKNIENILIKNKRNL